MNKEIKDILLLVAFGVVLTAVAVLVAPFVNVERSEPAVIIPPNGPITIEGSVLCLPHKNTSGPQTLECAFGLQDNQGIYYALSDSDPNYQNVGNVSMNVPVVVSGTFEAKDDSRYQSIGTITVVSITAADAPKRLTLEGQYLCLPRVAGIGPQTDECTFGIKTDDARYYALDFSLSSQINNVQIGQRIHVSGIFTPIERLSSDHYRQYGVAGILSVTDFGLSN